MSFWSRVALAVLMWSMMSTWVRAEESKERLALVIGNAQYVHIAKLANPRNDALSMEKALLAAGFAVTTVIDADVSTMRKALESFGRKLRETKADSVFYFAGHGVQLDGENYLIPVDASIQDESELTWQALRINDVLRILSRETTDLNIIILDACRNNPFPKSTRSTTRGLARIDAPRGSFIGYATAPGEVALDGTEKNSPYTRSLVDSIAIAGVPLEETFKLAREKVLKITSNRQTPWEASSIVGNFYFFPNDDVSLSELQKKIREQQDQLAVTAKGERQEIETSDLNILGKLCDEFSGSPLDPNASNPTEFATLRQHAEKAIDACKAVVERAPDTDRYAYQLGRAYSATNKNFVEAAHWYRKAANNYYPPALNALAGFLERGLGVSRDLDEAFKLYLASAEKGFVPAMVNVGLGYYTGTGTQQDFFRAERWVRKAAKTENPIAISYLGHFYKYGHGVVRDVEEAKKLLARGFKLGEPEAAWFLVDFTQDDVKRYEELLVFAAERGHRLAMLNLAGTKIDTDKKLAEHWLSVALTAPNRFDKPESEFIYSQFAANEAGPVFNDMIDGWAWQFENIPAFREYRSRTGGTARATQGFR